MNDTLQNYYDKHNGRLPTKPIPDEVKKCKSFNLETLGQIAFNRYDLLEVMKDKDLTHRMMLLVEKYGMRLKQKMMTINTPKKRRGDTETRYIQHFDIDSIIKHSEHKAKSNNKKLAEIWKQYAEDFKRVKEYMIKKQEKEK